MEQQLNYENIEKHFLKGACIVMLTGPPKACFGKEGRREGGRWEGREGGREGGRVTLDQNLQGQGLGILCFKSLR